MITINATGDTTLHTAGKYCAEDILVKVPAGGSSDGLEWKNVLDLPTTYVVLPPDDDYGTFYLEIDETTTNGVILREVSSISGQTEVAGIAKNVITGKYMTFGAPGEGRRITHVEDGIVSIEIYTNGNSSYTYLVY